ncbi:MAG: DUF3343 domain-containing protein [Clostridia bacterium]|nr:DUF3343 domain-containing protein [Clostridia bacterium]
MKYRYFAFSSLTYAYKGKDALDNADIRSKIIRLSGAETAKGCRYGIEVRDGEYGAAERELYRSRIPFTVPL